MEKMSSKSVDLSKYQHQPQFSSKSWRNRIWFVVNILFFYTKLPIPVGLKLWILRKFGAKVGTGVMIKPNVNIKFPWLLEIGNNVWIGEEVWIDNLVQVRIGSNACLSQGAMLLCGNHNYKSTRFDLMTAPITLEEGVWIGAKSIVCPGVTCYSHAMLVVGSVATGNLEAYGIYRGNPAAKIRNRVIE
ncbi:WcaF family extracellular polysaccharide biosynthesis acetyltransferase [Siphonobacter sp. SORGH_AS_0500]|uniref:WcaF family extracellular polysaccharide biosynthesis acetyltransferase n=1 Tax=Siphonobacter sp. SORGH_AS_0500 TaxID=1864824 RepID=UPI00285E87A9|nr:WcaF family extracellular polysaccharide biosynthesis acetyltransferase [Siphonobacter sp. SORGH_AS_0500]MDR6194862.1 putative colanic acid biosynthesis acetyltransferase WcaF [Siphonobacter sp. SORGH_AS_0500]